MKDFLNWLHHHPIKACGFTAWFTFGSCMLANPDIAGYVGGFMFGFGITLWTTIYRIDSEKDWREE